MEDEWYLAMPVLSPVLTIARKYTTTQSCDVIQLNLHQPMRRPSRVLKVDIRTPNAVGGGAQDGGADRIGGTLALLEALDHCSGTAREVEHTHPFKSVTSPIPSSPLYRALRTPVTPTLTRTKPNPVGCHRRDVLVFS